MSRMICLAIALGGLVTAPGCSSCFGNNGCRRPSFMEFRGDGCFNRQQPAPMAAPACGAPACDPCAAPAPCCEGGGTAVSVPASAPVVSEPGTFS